MIIKYCPECIGKPYTKHHTISTCPNCRAMLISEIVNENDLYERAELLSMPNDPFAQSYGEGFGEPEFRDASPKEYGFDDCKADESFDESMNDYFGQSNEFESFEMKENETNNLDSSSVNNGHNTTGYDSPKVGIIKNNNKTKISGKITNYTNSQKENSGYRRLFLKKIIDAIIYKQRFNDTLHSFTVRTDNGVDTFGNKIFKDVPINTHGIISGGLQLMNNLEVEVSGKFYNGVLMADTVYTLNDGNRSPVIFQHSVKAIVYGVLTILILGLLIYVGISSNGNFFQNIRFFVKIWLILSAVISALYLIFSFSKIGIMARFATGRSNKFPLIGILMVSLLLTLIFINSFVLGAGVGGIFSGLLSSTISIVIIIALFYIIFKLLLGLL